MRSVLLTPTLDAAAQTSLSAALASRTKKVGSVLESVTRTNGGKQTGTANANSGASSSAAAQSSSSDGLAAATGVPYMAAAAIGGGVMAVVGLL